MTARSYLITDLVGPITSGKQYQHAQVTHQANQNFVKVRALCIRKKMHLSRIKLTMSLFENQCSNH